MLAVGLALIVAIALQERFRPGALSAWVHLRLAVLSMPVWLAALALNRVYQPRVIARQTDEFRRIVGASAVGVGLTVSMAFFVKLNELSRLWMISVLVLVPLFLIVERAVARRVVTTMRRKGRGRRRLLIVGTDADAIGTMHSIAAHPESGYEVVGFVGPDALGVREGVSVLGGIDDVETVMAESGAHGVVISLSSVEPARVNQLTRGLTDAGYTVRLSPGLRDIDLARFSNQEIGGRTMLVVEQVIRHGWRADAKRTFDIVMSALGLLAAMPLLIPAAIALKLDSPGPLLFRQERVGKDGRRFHILKLRTMSTDAEARKAELMAHNEADGPLFKMAADPRVTRVGRVLRKLSIDEIPQFFNVLRGEMSVVGPRPATPDEVTGWDPALHDRLRVLPGITGLWQVSGRSDASFEDYKRFDLSYVDNWTLSNDLRIVGRTLGVVLSSRGAR